MSKYALVLILLHVGGPTGAERRFERVEYSAYERTLQECEGNAVKMLQYAFVYYWPDISVHSAWCVLRQKP